MPVCSTRCRNEPENCLGSLDELRTAQDRLVQTEKLASLGQLTAGIAHEIKNPLNFVNNFSALSAELVDELDETLDARSSRSKDARRYWRVDGDVEVQPRKGRAARQTGQLHSQEHAAAFARRLGRTAVCRHQHAGRGEPQPRLSRRPRRESRASISRCGATSTPTRARSSCIRRRLPGRCSISSPTGSMPRPGARPRTVTAASSRC